VSREAIIATSDDVLARPDLPLRAREDIFRIRVLELDWDIGGMVYEPQDASRIPLGADGKKAGVFLLHGGAGDHRDMDPLARLLAAKFGFKVASMTYPGQLYLPDPSRAWPGDTLRPDGTARTPIWKDGELIGQDQYDLVQERSDPVLRARHGTVFLARAKEGTTFYDRLAAAPMAMEEAMKAVCARNFPIGEYSVYVHGHSTGGPHVHMLLQRVENVAGLVGAESSPFGQIFTRMLDFRWKFPFNAMTVRTWRDIARYRGNEVPLEAVRRLPWLMEDVLDEWEAIKHKPNIKFQDLVQFAALDQLEHAARAAAKRLGLSSADTRDLVERYRAYPAPLAGAHARPIPPLLYSITIGSMDHRPERYRNILLPALGELDPAPKRSLTLFHAGVHDYDRAEPDLPLGAAPAIAELWDTAIRGGFYSLATRT
jgi:poly(3-hydroxybutyrate) depolymerase